MKCIYCNSEADLTISDIITYAVTGAKLTKTFVCKEHNAYTNDTYEKKFVADLDFFRNHLGFTTRDGKPIQYKADLTIDGTKLHNVKMSNKEALFAPKDVVVGFDANERKVILAPMERLEKISKGKACAVDISDVVLHKTITADSFLGFHAVHSIAKMAYEWYCYINDIEEYKEEYKEIVDYILGNVSEEYVDIIIDSQYYYAIDQLSEIGTNTFFQYDDVDGYRYVVVDFWKTIAYRVRICKSSEENSCEEKWLFKAYLYHVDGKKSKSVFGVYPLNGREKVSFLSIQAKEINVEIWGELVKRIEKIMSTMILSIFILKREVDTLTFKLKKYDKGKLDVTRLLGFEENSIVITLEVISQLCLNRDKYDESKSFNQNLPFILKLNGDTVARTPEDLKSFLTSLVSLDKENKLSEQIWEWIRVFNEIFEIEMSLTK